MFRGDWRIRARGDVGWHRLSPLPDARVDACSWDEPDLRVVHLRPMGSSQQGIYIGRMRHGFGQYFMGTGFLFMATSAISRMNQKPYVLGALAMLWGWVRSALKGVPRYNDAVFRRFLRRYQRRVLLIGKKRALEELGAAGTAP